MSCRVFVQNLTNGQQLKTNTPQIKIKIFGIDPNHKKLTANIDVFIVTTSQKLAYKTKITVSSPVGYLNTVKTIQPTLKYDNSYILFLNWKCGRDNGTYRITFSIIPEITTELISKTTKAYKGKPFSPATVKIKMNADQNDYVYIVLTHNNSTIYQKTILLRKGEEKTIKLDEISIQETGDYEVKLIISGKSEG